MKPHSTSLLQRIQEGLPLQVRVEREQATIEDGEGRRSHFPILPAEIPPLEGIYDAAFEVAQDGRFLTAGEISARPLKAWLGCKQDAPEKSLFHIEPNTIV